jgi:hypothetical protein
MKESRQTRAILYIVYEMRLQKIVTLGKRNEWCMGYLLVQQGVDKLRIFLSPIFKL